MEPLHITEFASERYFSKLRKLNSAAEIPADAANESRGETSLDAAKLSAGSYTSHTSTFTLPLGSPTRNKALDQPEKRYSFSRMLKKKRELGTKTITSSSKTSMVSENSDTTRYENFLVLFFGLAPEIQFEIISRLSIPKVLNLRLASKGLYNLVASNEGQIARYHIANTLPHYVVDLYPPPAEEEAKFHYLCAIWHRLHVASRLSSLVANQATEEIFLRTTELQRQEFRPQEIRMRHKLMRRILTLFHFFERYRELHVHHLMSSGIPLSRQASTTNLFEKTIFESYSGDDLLKAHEVFPLVMSSFSRRLRPPSHAGRLERSLKHYPDRPADEIYSTILLVGGLHQACFFWNVKGYNARRTAVDTWYNLLLEKSAKVAAKSQKPTRRLLVGWSDSIGGKKQGCHRWYCVSPDCALHTGENDHIPNTSLSKGPPMSSLTKEELQLFLPDLPHLSNIWKHTAEAVILERKIKERPQDIKRNTQVLLDLIKDDGTDHLDEDWETMLLDQTIDAPPSREELRSTERLSAEQRPSAIEQSGDATASEYTTNTEAATTSDNRTKAEVMKPDVAKNVVERIHTSDPGRSVQQIELLNSAPTIVTHDTTTAIESEISILEVPKRMNKTEKAGLIPIYRSSKSGTTVANSEGQAKLKVSHVDGITSNTSNLRMIDSASRPSNIELTFNIMHGIVFDMMRGILFAGVDLLQQVLGSTTDIWGEIWGSETELPEGMGRVKWRCSCGASMYDDFIELREGAAKRLEKSLNMDYESSRSSVSGYSSNNSLGTLKSFHTTALKSFLTMLGLERTQPGLPQHEMHILPGDSNSGGTNSTLPDPVWLLLCHEEGVYASKLAHIKVSDFDSDQKLFSALRDEYTNLRGKWLSKISFRRLRDIKFVGFEVHSGELVDIRPEEDLPPIDNTDYCYNPAPAELIPPIGHRHLMHLFQHPLHAQPKRVCYDRFPKKLRTRLACSDKPTELGWGLYLVEGWSMKKIWISGFVLSGIGSLIFGIVWAVMMHNIQDAFTVAAYWLTFGMFSIGTLQAILHLN